MLTLIQFHTKLMHKLYPSAAKMEINANKHAHPKEKIHSHQHKIECSHFV